MSTASYSYDLPSTPVAFQGYTTQQQHPSSGHHSTASIQRLPRATHSTPEHFSSIPELCCKCA